MKRFKKFSIPVGGLKNEVYDFEYTVGKTFFLEFEKSPIGQSNLSIAVSLDKRTDMIITMFDVSGTIRTDCDRCLNAIDLPIGGTYSLIFKYAEGSSDSDEVVFIPPETMELNLAEYIYEYSCLSIPLSKTYDCEKEEVLPCNTDLLNRLDHDNESKNENPIWDQLKSLDIKK